MSNYNLTLINIKKIYKDLSKQATWGYTYNSKTLWSFSVQMNIKKIIKNKILLIEYFNTIANKILVKLLLNQCRITSEKIQHFLEIKKENNKYIINLTPANMDGEIQRISCSNYNNIFLKFKSGKKGNIIYSLQKTEHTSTTLQKIEHISNTLQDINITNTPIFENSEKNITEFDYKTVQNLLPRFLNIEFCQYENPIDLDPEDIFESKKDEIITFNKSTPSKKFVIINLNHETPIMAMRVNTYDK